MRIKTLLSVCVTAGLVLSACGDKDDSSAQPTTSTPDDDTGGNSSLSTSPGDGDGDGDGDGTDGDDDGGTNPGTNPTGQGFIENPDGGTASFECDVWGQDCPDGQKCMPWDNSGQGAWNATKCTPLDPNPAQVGDECTVEGSGTSGVDNCALASMCWGVDPETNTGTCVSFCTGSEANPSCDNPSTTCSITNGGSLILCLPTCDPLVQDCVDGQACYGVGNAFICAPNASGPELGNYGDPCEYLNVCNEGLWCAGAASVPGCQGSSGCCSEWCDLSSPEGAAQCSGVAGGQECVPYFEPGQAPPGYADVGGCAIPN